MRTRAFLLALASKYVYSPLVGLTQTVAPSGTTADYAYDSANRLISVRRNGTEIQAVSYRIGQDADNRVTVSDVIRGNSKHVRLSHFDGLGRLIKTTDSSTGVSVSRKYDAMGRLYGEATYGLLDDLTFSYPSGSSQLQSVTSAAEGTDFYGRVGFPLAGSQYTWNDAGLMASDSGFGITKISYNDFGLPTRMSTQNRSNYTTCAYSADGQLLERKKFSPGSSPFRANSTGSVYSADRIFTTSTEYINLNSYISYFPGGYFDSSGGVHYIHLDYQGSVVMETDSAGHIEKHRGYYPYGEPWAESTNKKTLAASVAQPQTYQSKERTAATGDYDFGPRRYISAAPFWRTPDPKAHDYPNISPYAFCAANPVRYADPTGMDVWVLNSQGVITGRLETDLLDYIMVLNKDCKQIGSTQRLEKGTIDKVDENGNTLSKEDDDGKTRFKFNNKQSARSAFEMLGESVTSNSFVEVSLLTGSNGKKQFGYVTSSNQVGTDNSMTPIIISTYEKDNHSEFIHTHPFSLDMSGDDSFFDKITKMYRRNDKNVPRMGIYFTGNNSKSPIFNHKELNPFKNSYLYWNKK